MRLRSRYLLFMSVLALICIMPLSACSRTYSAESIEAWVVDADTGQPIEGVVVTANWQLETGSVGGNVAAGQLMVMEAVTDAKGRFFFPAWGPKSTPIGFFIPFLTGPAHLVNRDPQLVLFKSGYKWMEISNYPLINYNNESLRKSDWNGKTIKLEKFKGNLREYAEHLSYMTIGLRFMEQECNWKKTPKMILAIDQQHQVIVQSGIDEQSASHKIALKAYQRRQITNAVQ